VNNKAVRELENPAGGAPKEIGHAIIGRRWGPGEATPQNTGQLKTDLQLSS